MHKLVERFCTPPRSEVTNFDLKSVAGAEQSCIVFEGMPIPVYSWGEGKNVLLAHGWGSRASHLVLLARAIAAAGFKVYAFDAPAHSSTEEPFKTTSSMFEYGRALSAVASRIGNIYAVAGHSLGAITSIFTLSGYMKFAGYEFTSEKLVTISAPESMEALIIGFARNQNLSNEETNTLRFELEKEFNFNSADYEIEKALSGKAIKNLLIVHDEDDEEMDISNAEKIKASSPFPAKTFYTKGTGHGKILLNRDAMKAIANFINGKE